MIKFSKGKSLFLINSAIALLSTIIPYSANASGFYNPLQNVSDLGDAYAGSAAIAQDASTTYFNPAGMVRLSQPQLVISANSMFVHTRFSGTAYSPGLNPGGLIPIFPNSSLTQTGTESDSPNGIIPSMYFAAPINDKFSAGIGLSAPYGLGEDYGYYSVGRYDVTDARSHSVDIAPSLAYRITNQLSVGWGPDALYFDATQANMVRTAPFTTGDSMAKQHVDGWGFGWHGGLLYQLSEATRFGLNYHSGMNAHLGGGTSQFIVNSSMYPTVIANGTTLSNDLQTTMKLPPITTLSSYHHFDNPWAVMGTVEYAQWSVFNKQVSHNIASSNNTIISTATVPTSFRNTLRYAAGTSYELTQQWLLRTGLAYEQAATNDKYRDLILPESSRTDVAIGAHYQASKALGFDGGYVHAFYRQAPIRYTSPLGNTLSGNNNLDIDVVGVQMAWNI